MANVLQYASVFQSELDKAAVELSTSGWMEPNSSLIRYTGGKTVKVPQIVMDGLADYSNGFVDGDVTLTWQDLTFAMDRGRRFALDEHEVNDTNFVVTASQVMGEFQRAKVVPEIDAYRYSKIAAGAIAHKRAAGGYTPTAADILTKLYYDIAAVQDVVGSDTPLVITMSTLVAAILDTSAEISKKLDVVDFTQGGVTLKVRALNGEHPIRRVGSGRLKSAYIFADGKTEGQKTADLPPPKTRSTSTGSSARARCRSRYHVPTRCAYLTLRPTNLPARGQSTTASITTCGSPTISGRRCGLTASRSCLPASEGVQYDYITA